MKIRIYGLAKESIVDGNGIRYVVFTQGCHHNCEGCHNPSSHAMDGGREADTDEFFAEISQDPLLSGVTFSGGEPFLQVAPLLDLAKKIKSINLGLIIYTGFVFEDLLKMSEKNPDILKLMKLADNIIDGKFMLEKRNLSLRFRGSENQRIIDVKASFEQNKVITTEL